MRLINKIKNNIKHSRLYRNTFLYLRKIVLPGFGGIPLLDVIVYFISGLRKTSLSNRAAASSFKFFMALFPGLLFLVALIPYIPIPNFNVKLIHTIKGALPLSFFNLIETTIADVLHNKRVGLLSVGFVVAAFFSTNGMNGLMQAFNASALITETRKAYKQRLVAFLLTFFFIIMLIFQVGFSVSSVYFLNNWLLTNSIAFWVYVVLKIISFLIMISVFFFFIASIFYIAPARNMRWRFFSPGAALATLFSIIFTYGLVVYIQNFDRYNEIFGVLGAFPLLLVWIFLTTIALLIGFELNLSIRRAGREK